jgi:murein DD-endopeptidase MepM/ murein hydrolase activator NlpD
VQRGETLYRISRNYDVGLEEIAKINSINDITQISAGQMLIIPVQEASGWITWPVEGKVSSGFGRRGIRGFHSGIDIPAATGTPIRAVADGLVVLSGKSLDGYSRYGKIVIVEHGNGIRTVYAHNQKNHVKTGECVKAGEVIAEVGSSGNASGPHVHFEIRREGRPVNPLKYLP